MDLLMLLYLGTRTRHDVWCNFGTKGLKNSRIQERASDNICKDVSRGLKTFAKGTSRKHKLSNAHIGSSLVILKKKTLLTGSLGAKIGGVLPYIDRMQRRNTIVA